MYYLSNMGPGLHANGFKITSLASRLLRLPFSSKMYLQTHIAHLSKYKKVTRQHLKAEMSQMNFCFVCKKG